MQPHDTPSSPLLKQCLKCKEWLPTTLEYFHRQKAKRDGLNIWCKKCRAEYYQADKERHAARCRKNYIAKRDHLLRYQREYQKVNRAKVTAQKRQWRAEHPEVYRERRRLYEQRNKTKVNEWKRKWRISNKETVSAIARRRRGESFGASSNYTIEDAKRQYQNQKGKCYYCGKKVGDKYHVDHVVPLSRGGSNGLENIVIACPWCNQSKSDKLPHEWPQGGRLL